MAKNHKIMFMETSSKTRENVEDIFLEMSEKIIENFPIEQDHVNPVVNKSNCC